MLLPPTGTRPRTFSTSGREHALRPLCLNCLLSLSPGLIILYIEEDIIGAIQGTGILTKDGIVLPGGSSDLIVGVSPLMDLARGRQRYFMVTFV